MTDPIQTLLIKTQETDKITTSSSIRVSDSGDILFEVYNSGKQVKMVRGKWSYKDVLTIPSNYKDTILLYLLKEHHPYLFELKEWIKDKGIPFTLDVL